MGMFYLPKCPYCGIKIGKTESFVIKNKPLYKCFNCENVSEVSLKNGAYGIIFPVQFIAVVAFIAAVLLGNSFLLFGLVFIISTYVLFYGLSPYLIVLKIATVEEKNVSFLDNLLFRIKNRHYSKKKPKQGKLKQETNIEEKLKIQKGKSDEFTDIFSS